MLFEVLLIIPLALLLDGLFGDPPTKFHPTAWMGNLIGFALRFRPWGSPAGEFMFGSLLTLGGMAFVAAVVFGLQIISLHLPMWAGVFLQAVILKLTLSLRGLDRAAYEVQSALEEEDLPEARRLLSWHLVSRTRPVWMRRTSPRRRSNRWPKMRPMVVLPRCFSLRLVDCRLRWRTAS